MALRVVTYLVAVGRLHRTAPHIACSMADPAHALSHITAASGVVIVGVVTFAVATDSQTHTNPALIALNVGALGVAIFAFGGPLGLMRRRLREGKDRLEAANVALSRSTTARMVATVEAHEDASVGAIRLSLAALREEAEALRSASTWPWEPRTLRAFSTTLLLPIVTWLVTAGIGKLLDL